ncbi:hypothetical protein PPL_04764 [Heterostelium album PN500]|uniref:Uncharacterized protein n=1 Tax=Heterostelium pallidum (strain ATCC 26659 / Pp 5 / PN500) TaxID=670386 RepID=D3B8H1_HETP5|nr:hypothetical protein PPL_04764 [Heterostelium album PN500]EFA82339.1 hypothetical protein PPL_04764 [Heterostelium album PN500]|eukprot:XP_020434456.1 hypothetical protein PPL_04764 [Heterostelium album PN500]
MVQVRQGLTVPMRLMYALIFINMAIVIVIWIMMKKTFRSARIPIFHLGWWAFCFPMISFGSAALNYYKYTRFLSCKIVALIIVSISDFLYVMVACLTLYHLARRNLFISSRYKLPV